MIDEREDMIEPECEACGDTGYEPGMPGCFCTFCKRGCKIAHEQMKARSTDMRSNTNG